MTEPDGRRTDLPDEPPTPSPAALETLSLATEELREQPLPGALEIARGVLARALSAPRRTRLVRAVGEHAFVRVSTSVLDTLLQAAVLAEVPDVAVDGIEHDLDHETLRRVTLDLHVRFDRDVRQLGTRVHAVAQRVLADTLGTDDVDVALTHVHVSDVTVGDPLLTHPGDDAGPAGPAS